MPLRLDNGGVVADFTLGEGEKAAFALRRLRPEDRQGPCPGAGEAEELSATPLLTGGAGWPNAPTRAAGAKSSIVPP